jgi:hypothetical protein
MGQMNRPLLSPDNLDDTPLKVAVSKGFFSIVKLLVENGAKIDNHEVDFGYYDDLLDFTEEYGGVRTYEYLKSVNGK